MASEIITEEEEDDRRNGIDKEEEKTRIRKIISYQKSLYYSSSSSPSISSSTASATSSSSSPRRRTASSLFDLMRDGSTSLRRLFDTEHTSLGNFFKDYSVSPTVKPILLWGSDSDEEARGDPWAGVKKQNVPRSSPDSSDDEGGGGQPRIIREKPYKRRRRLLRTKSYKRLPGFSFWRCGVVRFRLKLMRRLRIVIRKNKKL